MWVIVVVLVGFITGPEIHAITDAGTFETKSACEDAMKTGVETQLDAKSKPEYEEGYRQYVCVRIQGADTQPK
ncbi:MAG: hypothetical protein K8R18_04980 [Parvibaculum sp.]|uniref:hypothetical protein n=1 Tax=Parvibaculum sp. TaxID=2024848 RepID=UPI0025F61D85|nr:hypothetical protein [Parvibaculum sp.]MCE9648964.1 hypothetical protein [Parvibaculum sp.]